MRPAAYLTIAIAAAVAAAQPVSARSKAKTVASSPAGDDGGRFQVTCGRCGKDKSCISVKLAGVKSPPATLLLSDESDCPGTTDYGSTELSARPFKAAPNVPGILVKGDFGGEAINHQYWLVGLVDGALKLLWDRTYGTREVVPIDSYSLKITDRDADGRQEIDYRAPWPITSDGTELKNMLESREEAADGWEHDIVELDDAGKAMAAVSPHQEYATVLASFDKLHDALLFKQKLLGSPKCKPNDFLVLESKDLPTPPKGAYVVAAIADSEKQARDRLAAIAACNPRMSPKIVATVVRVR